MRVVFSNDVIEQNFECRMLTPGTLPAHRDIADGGDGGIRIRLCLLEAETRQFDPFVRCFIRCPRAV